MQLRKISTWLFTATFGLAMCLSSCVDQEFDAPPAGGSDPDLTANISIAELTAMHTPDGFEEITEDLIIEAFVVSSDEAGNFFRQLIIQDETGGIELRIDATELHAIYPVGRKVFVKLKGLWLGDFNNLTQLGAAKVFVDGFDELARIPESLLDEIIFPGTFGNTITPTMKAIDELDASDISTLIQLSGVQFLDVNTGSTYADGVNNISVNLEIENCDKDRIIIRTSGFSSFATSMVPGGKGTITGVLGIFGSDLQILMRDETDANMDGERCQLGGGNVLDISSLRDAFNGGAGTADDGAIEGVVISDRASGNHVGQNMFVQDATGGIVVRFTSTHSYNLGDKVQVDVTGQTLELFNGLLQVNNVDLGNSQRLGSEALPQPREASIADILANVDAWESTRVKISDAMLSGQSTFDGNVTVTDASGAMVMFTRSAANFSSSAIPTGPVDVVAILSEFNTPQLVINSADDAGGTGTGGGDDLNESFTSLPDDADVDLTGWTNIATKGTRRWRVQVFDGNHYAQATAFNDTEAEMETWLVTPAIDISTPKNLTFETAMAFWEHDGLTVWTSTDFAGDVTTANWTELNTRIARSTDDDHAWISSDVIDLSTFGSDVFIAFKYEGSGPAGTSTSYRVDNIEVKDQ